MLNKAIIAKAKDSYIGVVLHESLTWTMTVISRCGHWPGTGNIVYKESDIREKKGRR